MDRISRVTGSISQGLLGVELLVVSRVSRSLVHALGDGKLHCEVVDHVEAAYEMGALVDDHGRLRVWPTLEESRTERDAVERRARELEASHGSIGERGIDMNRTILEKRRCVVECPFDQAEDLA